MSQKNKQTMRKKSFNSVREIKLAKERLRYECLFYSEKLKNSGNRLFAGFTRSLKELSFNIRNRLFAYSLMRSFAKSNLLYEFTTNFVRGLKRSREHTRK